MTRPSRDDSFIHALNNAGETDAVRMLEPILERSPWLARRLVDARPFSGIKDLSEHMEAQITALSHAERLVLLRAHPELAPPEPALMTAASQDEQGRLSLDCVDGDVAARLRDLNDRYRTRHGFPFIIALHAAMDIEAVLDRFASSLDRDTETEITRALGEVVSVASARLARQSSAATAATTATAAVTEGEP